MITHTLLNEHHSCNDALIIKPRFPGPGTARYSLLGNGAVAAVAATQISHGGLIGNTQAFPAPYSEGGITGVAYNFQGQLLVGATAGEALANVKLSNIIGRCWFWHNFAGFVLYGDPTVTLHGTIAGAVPPAAQYMPLHHTGANTATPSPPPTGALPPTRPPAETRAPSARPSATPTEATALPETRSPSARPTEIPMQAEYRWMTTARCGAECFSYAHRLQLQCKPATPSYSSSSNYR